jgi:hypothetical protein
VAPEHMITAHAFAVPSNLIDHTAGWLRGSHPSKSRTTAYVLVSGSRVPLRRKSGSEMLGFMIPRARVMAVEHHRQACIKGGGTEPRATHYESPNAQDMVTAICTD